MRARKIILLSVFLITIAGYGFCAGERERTLTVYYTASLNGNLDGCRCKNAPKAGLVKRGVFLSERPEDEHYLLLDGGDLFDAYPNEVLSDYILTAYRHYGYDAIGVGDQELAAGVDAFIAFQNEHPLLCHNLILYSDTYGKVDVSEAPLLFDRGGISVAVIAVISPTVFSLYPKEIRRRVRVTDPGETVRELLHGGDSLSEKTAEAEETEAPSAKPASSGGSSSTDQTTSSSSNAHHQADLLILLFHGPVSEARELTSSIEGIDIAIVSHEQKLIEEEMIGGTLLLSPGEQGNRIGVLRLTISTKKPPVYENRFVSFSYEEDPDDPYTRALIDSFNEAMSARVRGTEHEE